MARALVLSILLCSCCSVSTGDNPADAASEQTVISSSNRAFLPLAHRRGPSSPAQTKHEPSLAQTLRRDEVRRNHIVARSAGMILDSGTIITVLPAVAYAALRTAFRRLMAAYPLAPRILPVHTCYNLTGYSNVTVPSMALTFLGGATVDLDNPWGILVEGCLAFAGWSSDHGNGVIGNVNQRTFEVLYDTKQLSVGF